MPTTVRNTYRPDRKGVVAILSSPAIRAVLSEVGQDAKVIAQDLSPVRTGKYRSSFTVKVQTIRAGNKRRAAMILTNTDPKAAALEFGNTRSRPRRVMGRTQSALRVRGRAS